MVSLHGNVFRALHTVEDITANLETPNPDGEPTKLLKAVREFDSYLRPTPSASPTTDNAAAPARPSPPRSWNPPSTK